MLSIFLLCVKIETVSYICLYNLKKMQTSQKFSNIQLELLKLYANDVSDEDMMVFHNFISKYFAEKAIKEANKIWDVENCSNAKMDELISSNLRTPYIQK